MVRGKTKPREEVYRREEIGSDSKKFPWIVDCSLCTFLVSAKNEAEAWAVLEQHQRGDRCPLPLLRHGKSS